MRLNIRQEIVDWAIRRARLDRSDITAKHPWLSESDGDFVTPTLKQLETFAKDVRAPIGFFFLPEPPQEKLPIPDYRTMAGTLDRTPSPDLLDTVFLSQNRQEWYRGYALRHELSAPPYVGSLSVGSDVEEAASRIRESLEFSVDDRMQAATWTEALSRLVKQADDSGVLVMINGVVGNNPHRALNPQEFRGFALSDHVAPLIFVNGADTKAAQMFTMIHELAHIWVGRSALTDSTPADVPARDIERWCDKVAAEVLVPISDFRRRINIRESVQDSINRLARIYKVSTLVTLRRLYDAEKIRQADFWPLYEKELARLKQLTKKSKGGDFYATQNFRVSRRFARALVESTLRGETLYGEAFRLLSINKPETFTEYADRLGVG